MNTVVVDASVAVKWFLPEHDAGRAASLLRADNRLLAPDLLWIEVASVLWKVARRGAISADESQRMIAGTTAFPVETVESLDLLPESLRIASRTDRTVYDCLYLALAARRNAAVVTADERLVNGLRGTPWAQNAILLKDV